MTEATPQKSNYYERVAAKLLGADLDENTNAKPQRKSRQPLYNFSVPDQEFYSPRQVANLLLFSEQTLWRWIRNGRIPVVKFGRYYRIKHDTVLSLLESGNLTKEVLYNQASYKVSRHGNLN